MTANKRSATLHILFYYHDRLKYYYHNIGQCVRLSITDTSLRMDKLYYSLLLFSQWGRTCRWYNTVWGVFKKGRKRREKMRWIDIVHRHGHGCEYGGQKIQEVQHNKREEKRNNRACRHKSIVKKL